MLVLSMMGLGSFLLVGLSLTAIVGVACTAEQSCDCATAGVTVVATRGDVVAISTSGTACSGGAVICVSSADRGAVVGCRQWVVNPVRDGTCRIDVSLSDGSSHSAELQIENRDTGSCCTGLYATGDGTFVVPGPDAGSRPDGG
jgi:hypothetical protein